MEKLINFDILFDKRLSEFISKNDITTSKETALSIINDYEDKEWRYECFMNFIWDNIIETALSKKEREAIVDSPHSVLADAAKNLRLIDSDTDTGKGSEIAEILLYGILKHHYKTLSIVPKIFYKQNSNDFVKGADSVHIFLNEENNDFSLWFGEAKFYKTIEDSRLAEIVTSVGNMLQADKIKKENKIITNLKELELCIHNKELCEKVIKCLSGSVSLDYIRPRLHIPILLLYECEITARYNEKSKEYTDEIMKYHYERAEVYFRKQINALSDIPKYDEAHFHFIIFPVPNKKSIVDRFINQAKTYRGR